MQHSLATPELSAVLFDRRRDRLAGLGRKIQGTAADGGASPLSPFSLQSISPVPHFSQVPRVSRDDYPLPLHLARATVTEKDWVANMPPGSVARTVTPNVPRTVGVHLIRPVDELILMPAGIGATNR